jgi:hypothetical protein
MRTLMTITVIALLHTVMVMDIIALTIAVDHIILVGILPRMVIQIIAMDTIAIN